MGIIQCALLLYVQEAFGEDGVTFNCSKDVKRLPNTCNVSLIGESLVGHVLLSRCTCIMASIGAACHVQNKPSGMLVTVVNKMYVKVIHSLLIQTEFINLF
jgi:cysteine sulfinate desulfinase/cysteine desulfurase-like protein